MAFARVAFPAVTFRTVDVAEYAQTAQVFGYMRLGWAIVLPAVLVMVLLRLRSAKAA
ncbi:MAG: hypothetical protein ISS70_12860 [Phycisphaerae bacterium]|nr:hypothetical protein [Phycisphaerae bacterium]